MTMTRRDQQDTDDFVRRHFRIEPAEDRSGMFVPQRATEDTEEARFEAFMARWFPQSASGDPTQRRHE
jgi:hypothetical protein